MATLHRMSVRGPYCEKCMATESLLLRWRYREDNGCSRQSAHIVCAECAMSPATASISSSGRARRASDGALPRCSKLFAFGELGGVLAALPSESSAIKVEEQLAHNEKRKTRSRSPSPLRQVSPRFCYDDPAPPPLAPI